MTAQEEDQGDTASKILKHKRHTKVAWKFEEARSDNRPPAVFEAIEDTAFNPDAVGKQLSSNTVNYAVMMYNAEKNIFTMIPL